MKRGVVRLAPWLRKAKEEKERMKRLASAVPLVDTLRGSVRILNECNVIVETRGEGRSRSLLVQGDERKGYTVACLLEMLDAFMDFGIVDIRYSRDVHGFIEIYLGDTIEVPEQENGNTRILAINKGIREWRQATRRNFSATSGAVAEALDLLQIDPTKERKREEYEYHKLALRVATTIQLFRALAYAINEDALGTLRELVDGMLDKVQQYKKIKAKLQGNRLAARQTIVLRRTMLSLIHPLNSESRRMLREQYEAKEDETKRQLPKPTGGIWFDRWGPNPNKEPDKWHVDLSDPWKDVPEREAYEVGDATERFPALCRLLRRIEREERIEARRKHAQELREEREWKKAMRDLLRAGVPQEFIADSVTDGVTDPDEIELAYIRSLPDDDTREAVVARWEGFRKKERREEPGTEETLGYYRSYEELLESISFSESVERYVREQGFTVRDVVFMICKGFDFGKRCSAVGNAHYRGAIVRRNLRRARLTPKRCLRFLKQVDILKEWGSSASTRTKDEAIAVNTNPDNEIGREIVATLNAAFLEQDRS